MFYLNSFVLSCLVPDLVGSKWHMFWNGVFLWHILYILDVNEDLLGVFLTGYLISASICKLSFAFWALLVAAAFSRMIRNYLTKYKWVATVFKSHRGSKNCFCESEVVFFVKTGSCHHQHAAGWNLSAEEQHGLDVVPLFKCCSHKVWPLCSARCFGDSQLARVFNWIHHLFPSLPFCSLFLHVEMCLIIWWV